tara:strand:- start:246 stop:1376 length:1131 start_codon:yes stop_codon:yes gene_type:complete
MIRYLNKPSVSFLFIRNLLGITIILFVYNCGSTSTSDTIKIDVEVLHPAKVNLKEYPRIAIGDIIDEENPESKHPRDIADQLTSILVSSQRFEIIDRYKIDKILEEHNFSISGLSEHLSAAELGKFLGAGVLVIGRISQDRYSENIQTNFEGAISRLLPSSLLGFGVAGAYGSNTEDYYTNPFLWLLVIKDILTLKIDRKAEYRLSANIKFIDIQTGKIVYSEIFTAENSDRKKGSLISSPAEIDSSKLYLSCLKDISEQFLKTIGSYTIDDTLTFQTDSLLSQVKLATDLLEVEEIEDGLKIFEGMASQETLDNSVKAKAFYNLGIAQILNHKYKDALANMKKALHLNPTSSRYKEAINIVKEYEQRKKQVDEQQ